MQEITIIRNAVRELNTIQQHIIYIQRRAVINVVIDSENIQQRPEHSEPLCPKNKRAIFGQFGRAGHSYKNIVS